MVDAELPFALQNYTTAVSFALRAENAKKTRKTRKKREKTQVKNFKIRPKN